MKIVTGSIVVSALMIGVAGAAYAQSGNPGAGGMSGVQSDGTQSDGTNSAGAAAGTSLGTGAGPTSGVGLRSPAAIGGTGGAGAGPALNNMRANGTSLNMNPDPRAPNVTGRAAPLR